jgi:glycosyltransferase involved in cell wall biosynthesis
MWSAPNLQLAAAARTRGIPYIVTIHGMIDDWCMQKSRFRKQVYLALGGRRWLRDASLVISTAAGEVEQTRRFFPTTPVEIIPAPMDLAEYQDLPGPDAAETAFGAQGTRDLADDRPSVLFLSRIHPKKGLEVLIESIDVLRRRGREVRLLIAGGPDGPYRRQMEMLVDRLGLGDDVRLLGPVAGELKRSLFERADVFALATHQENFGIVFTESLACRTPVVTTRGVDIWPELESSGGALIADRTPEAFADAIERIVSEPGMSSSMGSAGRRWVMEYLDVSRITERFVEVYAKAIAEGPRR